MKDILKKQKIKKRTLSRKFLLFFMLTLVLSSVVWLLWRDSGAEVEPPLWAVEVKTMDASPLPQQVKEFILATASQHLHSGARQQLQEVATAIGLDPQLAAVQVIRTTRGRVVVYVDLRRPRVGSAGQRQAALCQSARRYLQHGTGGGGLPHVGGCARHDAEVCP